MTHRNITQEVHCAIQMEAGSILGCFVDTFVVLRAPCVSITPSQLLQTMHEDQGLSDAPADPRHNTHL